MRCGRQSWHPGTSTSAINYGPPNLNFTNFGALSDASPALTRNQGQRLSENIIFSRGKHTVTLGVQYTRSDLNSLTDPNGRGTFNFTGLATGFDFSDFLLGLPQSSSIRYGDSSTYFYQNAWNGYVVDDWKMTTNLSLNSRPALRVFLSVLRKVRAYRDPGDLAGFHFRCAS